MKKCGVCEKGEESLIKVKCSICGRELNADADVINDIAARNECSPDDLPVSCSESCSEICKRELSKLIEKQRRLISSIGGGGILKDSDEWSGMINEKGVIQ